MKVKTGRMLKSPKPRIVVSAVNFSDMGPLTILKDVLTCLGRDYSEEYEIVAIVHRRSLFDTPNVTYLEFPEVKGSWWRRIRFEYFGLRKLSAGLNATIWLSLHDVTPNVVAFHQIVYCHNPSPFYRLRFRDAFRDPVFGVFNLFYGWLYRFNIHKNSWVVVQQNWIREEFKHRYKVKNVIVAHPEVATAMLHSRSNSSQGDGTTRFFFPSYPRVFKNAELLLEAAMSLERSGVGGFEVWVTFNGTENAYAAHLVRRYSQAKSARFLGLLPRSEVFERYRQADCLVFPSKLETWGLPVTEFKGFCKPMLLADLPYARETVGSYNQVAFFDPADSNSLALLMRSVINGTIKFENVRAPKIEEPFSRDWGSLFRFVLGQKDGARKI